MMNHDHRSIYRIAIKTALPAPQWALDEIARISKEKRRRGQLKRGFERPIK